MQAPATPSSRTNHELRGRPKYNEIHVDREVSVTTTNEPRLRVAQIKPKYSLTPIIYSPSGSSRSEYSQSSHDHESPATSVERSSDPVSEGTLANLDTMLISRNTSSATRSRSAGAGLITDREAHRELVDFLKTCEPPQNNSMSATEDPQKPLNRKPSFKLFAKRSTARKRAVKLPEIAVAATTASGRKHIAIAIRDEHDRPESQYHQHAPGSPIRTSQKLQKAPPRPAGSGKPNPPMVNGSAKTGTVTAKKPVVELSSSHARNRSGSVRVNVEQDSGSSGAQAAAQHNPQAPGSRSDLNAPEIIGADTAVLLQRFWDQHPPSENRRELSAPNRNLPLKVSQAVQSSPGRQGSEMTDPRHSGGTAYSERTLGTATASAGHSRESSSQSNSSKQPPGSRLLPISNQPARTLSRSKESNAAAVPATPRSFAMTQATSTPGGSARHVAIEIGPPKTSPLRSEVVVPAENQDGESDLISLSGFLGFPSHGRPQQPGPAPNRKLPDLPEGGGNGRHASSPGKNATPSRAESSMPRAQPSTPRAEPSIPRAELLTPKAELPISRAEPSTPRVEPRAESSIPRVAQSSPKASSKVPSEKPTVKKNETDYPDHPINRKASNAVRDDASLAESILNARQQRQDRVRVKKQRDIALAKEQIALPSQSGVSSSREESQHQTTATSPPKSYPPDAAKGSVRAARKRTENLLPPPLDLGTLAITENEDRPQTSRSLPPATSYAASELGNGLPATTFGSGRGKGSVRHARKRSENLMSSLAKVEASPFASSKLENPSLRAAANALSSIMVGGEENPSHLKHIPHLPPPIPKQAEISRMNEFPLPPRSAKRQSPYNPMTGNSMPVGLSAMGAQTPPRSPSPSLQSSEGEVPPNDGRNVTSPFLLKSPIRSRSQSNSTSTRPTVVSPRSKTTAIHPSQRAHHQVATITPNQSRSCSGSSSTTGHDTHPPLSQSSRQKQGLDPTNQTTTANLTAAINAFDLHRANRRKERNRLIRDRRARELALQKERAAHDEAVDKRLAKGEEKHGAIEDRLKRIEDRGFDMASRYGLMMNLARDLEDMKSKLQVLEERFTAHNNNTVSARSQNQTPRSRGREASAHGPERVKLGSRRNRGDIGIPPSATEEHLATADQGVDRPRHTASQPESSRRRQRAVFHNRDLDFSGAEDGDALPQYSGRGLSDLLGGGGSGGGDYAREPSMPGRERAGTPIGSLIEDLEFQGSSYKGFSVERGGRDDEDRHGGREGIKRVSLPKIRRAARSGSVRYHGSQRRGAANGWEASSAGTALPSDV